MNFCSKCFHHIFSNIMSRYGFIITAKYHWVNNCGSVVLEQHLYKHAYTNTQSTLRVWRWLTLQRLTLLHSTFHRQLQWAVDCSPPRPLKARSCAFVDNNGIWRELTTTVVCVQRGFCHSGRLIGVFVGGECPGEFRKRRNGICLPVTITSPGSVDIRKYMRRDVCAHWGRERRLSL